MSENRSAHSSKEKPQTKLQIPKEAKVLELANQEWMCIFKNLFNSFIFKRMILAIYNENKKSQKESSRNVKYENIIVEIMNTIDGN